MANCYNGSVLGSVYAKDCGPMGYLRGLMYNPGDARGARFPIPPELNFLENPYPCENAKTIRKLPSSQKSGNCAPSPRVFNFRACRVLLLLFTEIQLSGWFSTPDWVGGISPLTEDFGRGEPVRLAS